MLDSFERISASADLVLVEGAGSPAEVNLRTGDIAPDIAIDGSTGDVYVVWQSAISGTPAIYLSKSTDGDGPGVRRSR